MKVRENEAAAGIKERLCEWLKKNLAAMLALLLMVIALSLMTDFNA